MPSYLVRSDGVRIGWGTAGSPPDAAPAAPTGVSATAGNGQITISWAAPAEGDIASHRIRRVNADGSTTLIQTVNMPALSGVVTGLTNGTQYTHVVRAVDNAGQSSANSAQVSATPKAPVTTIFGYNTNESGAPLSSRLVKWDNRAPMVRRYNGGYLTSGTFNITTSVAPEKRVCYSVKADGSGSFTVAGLAAGNGNARLKSWCESIPANWHVIFVYYHEVNDDIREGRITAQQYKDAYAQFRTAIDSAVLQPGVKVQLACNFMAFRVADTPTYFDDSWVPPTTVCDLMTFDVYGNPGHFTTSTSISPNCSFAPGPEYTATFPVVATRFRDALEAIVRNGYKDKWGILEHNTPPRDWDGPANPDYVCGTDKRLRYQGGRTATGHNTTGTEVERAQWLVDSVEYCLSGPTILSQTLGPPSVWLFWEHPEGVNWNQRFYHDNVWNALKPYIVNTPVGG